MPRRDGGYRDLHRLPLEERLRHACGYQAHWYRHAAQWAAGREVLDVGAGDGYGMDILRAAGAARVVGIDPMPLREDVLPTPIENIADRSYDLVIACDVIEHVEDDRGFLADLLRCARVGVFVSTPNWTASRCVNEFHVREYTAEELVALLAGLKHEAWTSGDARTVEPIVSLYAAASNFGVAVWC